MQYHTRPSGPPGGQMNNNQQGQNYGGGKGAPPSGANNMGQQGQGQGGMGGGQGQEDRAHQEPTKGDGHWGCQPRLICWCDGEAWDENLR